MSAAPYDIAIIGAGAAGLTAAIFCAEAARDENLALRIVALEGARKPGAKILVSGGGRCNVTNTSVTLQDYSGGPSPIIRNVLRAFDESRTLEWMRDLGVDLKLEPTGKYFPRTDKARTVLDALLGRLRELDVELLTDVRVSAVVPLAQNGNFQILLQDGSTMEACRVIVATGGLSLPKSGSDGAGLNWMRQLGHTILPTTPSLVPLLLETNNEPGGRFAEWAGVTLAVRLTLVSETGKHLVDRSGSVVFTHLGISGPAAMDISRHITQYMLEHPGSVRVLLGHIDLPTAEAADQWLQEQTRQSPGRHVLKAVTSLYPERMAEVVCTEMSTKLGELKRQERLELARRLAALPLTVSGTRGYTFAETTAGGVDLREIDARTMQSRIVPGLFLCGEILDVDGRIGGFNFQWAWASGYVAGRGAAKSLVPD